MGPKDEPGTRGGHRVLFREPSGIRRRFIVYGVGTTTGGWPGVLLGCLVPLLGDSGLVLAAGGDVTCDVCAGLLVHEPGLFKPDVAYSTPYRNPRAVPCPTCLTYPATEDVRAVAREWLGSGTWPQAAPWTIYRPPAHYVRGLPLHLPAGRDLAVRVLAKRLGRHADDVGDALRWYHMSGGAHELLGNISGDRGIAAAVPADAPLELRAARALVLCLQATEATAAYSPSG